MYISIKFGTGVHVFCWEVGVFNRSSFQSVLAINQCKIPIQPEHTKMQSIRQHMEFSSSNQCMSQYDSQQIDVINDNVVKYVSCPKRKGFLWLFWSNVSK